MNAYDARIEEERRQYENCEDVHDLPPIFHYWSNRYLRPRLESFGFSSPDQMFEKSLVESYGPPSQAIRHFASLGCGNCDLEVRMAQALRKNGRDRFVIDCIEINHAMLERGRSAALEAGVEGNLNLVQADLNQWIPSLPYDAVLANQSLHHVVNLEHLFGSIKDNLKPGGQFAICDTIGRNGNVCWPEALQVVHEFWRRLPPSYRYNRQLHHYQEMYESWDCSQEGFEAIRSQDILPLLVATFQFRLFVGHSHVIEPLLGRAYGHNFDAGQAWDREFVDQLHQRDQEGASSGELKPTQVLAVVGNEETGPTMVNGGPSPRDSIRWPSGDDSVKPSASSAYAWHTWPHAAARELEIACKMLSEAEARAEYYKNSVLSYRNELEKRTQEVQERTEWAQKYEREFKDRTEWALDLEKELAVRTEQSRQLQSKLDEVHAELADRTTWARNLDAEIERLTALVRERTSWAQKLAEQLDEKSAWAGRLQKESEEWRRSYELQDAHPVRRLLGRTYRRARSWIP